MDPTCWRSSRGHQSAGGEGTWAAARPTDKCKLPRVTECPRVLMALGGPFPSGELQLPSGDLELTPGTWAGRAQPASGQCSLPEVLPWEQGSEERQPCPWDLGVDAECLGGWATARPRRPARSPQPLPGGSLVLSARMWAASWMAWWPGGHSLASHLRPGLPGKVSPQDVHSASMRGAVSDPSLCGWA